MSEMQRKIAEWAQETFGPVSTLRVAARANEEMAELLREISVPIPNIDKVAEEAADVVIVLYRLAHLCGHDLDEQVRTKMLVNMQREWKVDSGTGQHFREKT